MRVAARHRPCLRWSAAAIGTVRMGCDCGTAGPDRDTTAEAEHDIAAHREAVAPPPDRRCRSPRRHRAQWWDHCPTCSDQLPLFDLPDLEVSA